MTRESEAIDQATADAFEAFKAFCVRPTADNAATLAAACQNVREAWGAYERAVFLAANRIAKSGGKVKGIRGKDGSSRFTSP